LTAEFDLPIAGAAAALSICAWRALDPGEAVVRLFDWLSALAAFWLALQAARTPAGVRSLCAAAVPLFWIELGSIVFQRWSMARSGAPFWLPFSNAPGTLVNANAAAAFHLLWIPVLLRQASEDRPRLYWTSGAACCLAGLLLLNSAWALVCLLAGAPFLQGPRPWVKRPWLPLGAAAAALGLAAWKICQAGVLLGSVLPLAQRTARLGWWASAWRMFLDHPWLGVGLGNFAGAYPAYKAHGIQSTLFPHDFALGLLAETGLLGSGALLAFAFLWAFRLRGNRPAVEERWPFLLGAGLQMLFTTVNIGMEMLANLLGLGIFLGAAAAGALEPSRKLSRPVAALAAAFCLAAVPYALMPFLASRCAASGEALLSEEKFDDAARSFDAAVRMFPLSKPAREGLDRALRRAR
jgi:O-antigen ligase